MTEVPKKSPWYAEGLQFECTSCGNCCSGPEGAVWFTYEEGRLMAEHMGLLHDEFLRRHTRVVDGNRSLNERKTKDGFDCAHLDRTSVPGKAICSIYEVRPLQCRTWPIWPEVVKSRAAWDRFKKITPCHGMNSGPVITIEEIVSRLDKHRKGTDGPW